MRGEVNKRQTSGTTKFGIQLEVVSLVTVLVSSASGVP